MLIVGVENQLGGQNLTNLKKQLVTLLAATAPTLIIKRNGS